jgi:hypothetical protein
MKDLLFVLMVLGGILFLIQGMEPKPRVEQFYNDFERNQEVHISASAYLVSADKNNMQGSATVYKRLDKELLTIYCEANLPMAIGGNFTNENVVYKLFGGNSEDSLEFLSDLERFPDGFYKANYFEDKSDNYHKLKYFMICSNDENGLVPVLKGKF